MPDASSAAPSSRWYFGWVIVAASTLLTLLTVGMRMGVGPFFLPMIDDLGLTRSELSEIVAAGVLVYGLAMPLAGYLVTAWSTRSVLLIGAAIVAGSIAWTVVAETRLALMLAFGVLLSVGLAFTSPISLTPVITRWFVRQRGMALFFLSAGSMAGIAILTPLFTRSIEQLGWRTTMISFAVLFVLVTVPVALLIIRENAPAQADLRAGKRRPRAGAAGSAAQPGPPLRFTDALRSRPFWIIVAGLLACGFSMNLLGTHAVPMLMDHGFDEYTSAYGIALIGLVAIFSSFFLGRISDLIDRKILLAIIYFVRGLGFFGLVWAGLPWELYSVSAIGGMVWAGSIALSSAILADIYGVRLVGVLYGWTYVGHQIAGTISSWLGGWAYETYGTHLISFGLAGVFLIFAAAISLRLPGRGYTLSARPVPA